jgi:hypothetical protein
MQMSIYEEVKHDRNVCCPDRRVIMCCLVIGDQTGPQTGRRVRRSYVALCAPAECVTVGKMTMTDYLVFLAGQTITVTADMVIQGSNYELDINGQVQTLCFYKGHNPTRDHVVAEFVYKNISGYIKATDVKILPA